jgi:hypothetical protein
LQDESKGESPKEQIQQPPSEPPIPSQGEGPNKVEGDRVETEKIEEKKGEEKHDGPDPETRSLNTEDLHLDSSISQPKPSVSAKSNQASSTQELTHDSESMPEAEAGGP